ncbi:FAD-dependent oxidoreductase [Microbacterium sp. 179-I 3D2 NHS]|uniref:FAD-dependent oxidoreductase n=1 Tax=Microbacterium sp. 179-I 3D2 NHS TaxID=3235178 RepID=UPI0039A10A30
MRHQSISSDLTVIGGGLAGVAAAISAARLGKKVALVGNRPVLGGNSSSEVRVWVCGATSHGIQRYARETGVIGELYTENQYRNPEGNPIHWDEVVLDAVRAEPGISLFLNTDVRTIDAGESGIRSVTGWTMGSEIETTFTSPLFVDATGDGLIGALAGADHRIGREARSEYDEEWAPDEADGELLGSTLLFYTKDVGHPVRFIAPDSAKDILQTPIPESRIIRSGDSGAHYWWIEWGGHLDTVDQNEAIRDELRSVIFGIWDHIKNSGRFDAENLDLEWVGSLPGKREYRRFLGDHVLSQRDILEQRVFPDAVAFGGWSIDLHPVEGMYATASGAHQRYSDGIYGIPLRSLYSRNVPNLLVAGRDISASHVAFGSTRVMATCATTGEAVGTAASLALDLGVGPRELATRHASDVQQLLLKQDASIFGVANTDDDDAARRAAVSASSRRRDLDQAGGSSARGHALDADLAVVVPVDPRLDSLALQVRAPRDVQLTASLWTTGRPQNFVPIAEQRRVSVSVTGSDELQWVELPLEWHPDTPENVVVIVDAAPDVSVVLVPNHVPGMLALPHIPQADGDENVEVDESEAVVSWPARPLRGWAPRVRVTPLSDAFAPDKAVGGYSRPFGGPQMWVADGDADEWLALEWESPEEIAEVRLTFDDDLDVELNTLHHHRSPDLVFPEIVRDYTVEVRGDDDGWEPVVRVEGNRRRHRVHRLDAPVRTRALRVAVHATNGDPHARIVALRVH